MDNQHLTETANLIIQIINIMDWKKIAEISIKVILAVGPIILNEMGKAKDKAEKLIK